MGDAVELSWSGAHAGAILSVDLAAILANYRLLCARAAPAPCAAVLKADAYGLGAVAIGAALYGQGCRHFFVAHLPEGIALRPHLPADAVIFVLHGPPPGCDDEFPRHRLIPVLNSLSQMAGWRRLARTTGVRAAAVVQVDSGMSRMGLSPAEIDAWARQPALSDGIDVRFLMSHLACADQPEHPMNQRQLERFVAARRVLPACPASLANSSGIFLPARFHFDLVRAGAALYGIAPVAGAVNPLRPAVRLQAKILQTRTIGPGEQVGYGHGYTAPTRRRIATLSIGYADGWPRQLSNQGVAAIAGQRVRQVGRISMDSVTLDISELGEDQALPGELADLIWDDQPVDAVAATAGTIGYEILTNLGPRIARQYV
ncbi:alanine racemase [Burkholderia sp. LMU1-1-1.1]|uniref:alanine racemase n=1 Tax=Burkholderia sp. LMU1-1-1.1 TaxID=3135266 RepID=UPI0034473964